METSEIINQISLVIANLILTISILCLTFKKYEDSKKVVIPKSVIVMLLVYVLILLISFISMGKVNILIILFYLIMFVALIVLLILSLDNFNLKGIVKNSLLYLMK